MPVLQLFELDESLERGSYARARLLAWNGASYTVINGKSVMVYSYAGAHGVPGDRGYCFVGESNRWEVIGELASSTSLG